MRKRHLIAASASLAGLVLPDTWMLSYFRLTNLIHAAFGSVHESRSSRAPETPTAPVRLNLSRLEAFGGISVVASEFQKALCLEERCNWFCILLDYTALMQVCQASCARDNLLILYHALPGVIEHATAGLQCFRN